MKKIMIATALTLVTFVAANAQQGKNKQDNRDNDRYDNRGGYDNRDNRSGYDNRNGRGNMGDRIDDFQREARHRIADGVAHGSITHREAKHLMRDVERIERKEQIFWRDRVLDPRERRILMDDLMALNREITHEKRDNERSTYNDYGRNDQRYGRRN